MKAEMQFIFHRSQTAQHGSQLYQTVTQLLQMK